MVRHCDISKVKTSIDFLAIPPGAAPSAVPQCFLRLELVARPQNGNKRRKVFQAFQLTFRIIVTFFFWLSKSEVCTKTEAEVPEGDGHEAPKAQSPRRRSFWLELSGSTVLEPRSQETKFSSLFSCALRVYGFLLFCSDEFELNKRTRYCYWEGCERSLFFPCFFFLMVNCSCNSMHVIFNIFSGAFPEIWRSLACGAMTFSV